MKTFLVLSAFFVLVWSGPVGAVPLTGYVEATAVTGWVGDYAVQLPDGSLMTGETSLVLPVSFAVLPLSMMVLNIHGDALLGSLGAISWAAQPVWGLDGSPSPDAAVLANIHGLVGGITLTPSTFSFGFNGTLTSTFMLTDTGQALQSLRLDFADGIVPPVTNALLRGNVYINNGVPVAFGTPLSTLVTPRAVPEMTPLWLLALGLAIVLLVKMRQLWKLT